MSATDTTTFRQPAMAESVREHEYPGFCIVFDDEEVERDGDGYFIKPDHLAGTHPRDYACGADELIIRMPADRRGIRA